MYKKLKSRVASLREKVELTQVQLAVLVGVTPNTIQNWEKEDGLAQLERYLKLAEVFDCKVSDLFESVPVPKEEERKSKGVFSSVEDVRNWRERRESGTKAQTTESQSKPKFQAERDKR